MAALRRSCPDHASKAAHLTAVFRLSWNGMVANRASAVGLPTAFGMFESTRSWSLTCTGRNDAMTEAVGGPQTGVPYAAKHLGSHLMCP